MRKKKFTQIEEVLSKAETIWVQDENSVEEFEIIDCITETGELLLLLKPSLKEEILNIKDIDAVMYDFLYEENHKSVLMSVSTILARGTITIKKWKKI